jgi:tetratricopeptide (TPR) repeat protein
MQIKGRQWNMRQQHRRNNPFKVIFLLAIIGFLVYVNLTVQPLSSTIFLASPTPTVSAETYLAQAENLASEGKYTQALAEYQKAIIADPQNPSVYLAAAKLNIYSSDYEKAIENASNAVLLNPNSSMGEALQGFAQGLQGDYLDAESSLNRAIELDAGNATAYAYLSIVLSQKVINGDEVLGDLDQAIEASRNAQNIAPDAMETHWARGNVLEITSNYEDAVAELEQAVAQNENIAELHIALGRNYRYLDDNDLAVEEYTRANALNPSDSYPETLIARTYANIGEYGKAIQYAQQAVDDAPEDPYMYGNLGTMYKKNYQYPEAILMLKLAIRGGMSSDGHAVEGIPLSIATRVVEYYYSYGLALMELGYCSDAVDIAQSILQSINDDEVATYNANYIIENCYQKMNDLQLLKLPTPTMIPTWTPQPSATPTLAPTAEITATVQPY